MAFLSIAPPDMSAPPRSTRNAFAFGASEEQSPRCAVPTEDMLTVGNSHGSVPEEREDGILPILPSLANLSMDMVDPILWIDISALNPMDGIMAKPLPHYKGTSHPVNTSAATELEDLMAESLPDSLRSVSDDNHGNPAPRKTKITRIVIKKSGNRKTGPTNRSEDDDGAILDYQINPSDKDVTWSDCEIVIDVYNDDAPSLPETPPRREPDISGVKRGHIVGAITHREYADVTLRYAGRRRLIPPSQRCFDTQLFF
ncbi:hypothetical protein QBC46DRAFT_412033 [Diplogelasinospora grovesii]|uniref:Uncharacterized protein n=1 Tax=Diplogelasinospora grovesii TaxID=303347 RepID=A0AAN6S1H4_9PEZI|nr:hypothetical protein QBC46DRAFT_412033 [Diplogelasinospora grovesii]